MQLLRTVVRICAVNAAFHDTATDILAVVGVSGDFPIQPATGITSGNRAYRTKGCRRVGRVGVGVDVGVVECGLNAPQVVVYAFFCRRRPGGCKMLYFVARVGLVGCSLEFLDLTGLLLWLGLVLAVYHQLI